MTKIERKEENSKAYQQPTEKGTYKQRGISPPFSFCSINIENDIKMTTTENYKGKKQNSKWAKN